MGQVLLLAVLFCSAAVAQAQIASLYVLSANHRFTNVQNGSFSTSSSQPGASFWTSGIGGGFTFNFLPAGVINLGIDLRGSTRSGTVGADTGMAGIRLGVHPILLPIKPYVQASGGYIETRTVNASGGGTFRNHYAAWEVFGGVDYPLIHFLDFRVIEIGGGKGTVIGSSNGPDISLLSIDTGLVLHF